MYKKAITTNICLASTLGTTCRNRFNICIERGQIDPDYQSLTPHMTPTSRIKLMCVAKVLGDESHNNYERLCL